MANPGHALAATNLAEIQILKTELALFKAQHQMAMTHLSRGIKELTELLEAKGVAGKGDFQSLASLNLFMSMSHQQGLW